MISSAEELASIIREFRSELQRTGIVALPPTFQSAAHRFLSEHIGEPHAFADFFDALALVSEALTSVGRHFDALSLWQEVHRMIAEWQAGNQDKPGYRPIHLGTPFYFSSGIHFKIGNREHALMLMHLAVEQDERNRPGEDTPARMFISLDVDNPDQYLRPIVARLSEFLKYRLDWYNTFAEDPSNHPYGKLTWDEFRLRFLAQGGDLSSVAAFYVFSVARAHSLWTMTDAFAASRFAARIYENTLLNLCIVFEELVRPHYKSVGGATPPPTMKPLITFLAQQTGLSLTGADLNAVQAARNHNFDAEITRLISNRGPVIGPAMTWRIEEDLLIMFALRDPAAHQIRPLMTAVTRFQFLCDSVLNAIFFVVERLYP